MTQSQTVFAKFIASTPGSFIVGFLPFFLLGGFAAMGRTGAGLLAALALMTALVIYRVIHRNVKSIEVALCGWLAVVGMAHFTNWSWGLAQSETLLHAALAVCRIWIISTLPQNRQRLSGH